MLTRLTSASTKKSTASSARGVAIFMAGRAARAAVKVGSTVSKRTRSIAAITRCWHVLLAPVRTANTAEPAAAKVRFPDGWPISFSSLIGRIRAAVRRSITNSEGGLGRVGHCDRAIHPAGGVWRQPKAALRPTICPTAAVAPR